MAFKGEVKKMTRKGNDFVAKADHDRNRSYVRPEFETRSIEPACFAGAYGGIPGAPEPFPGNGNANGQGQGHGRR